MITICLPWAYSEAVVLDGLLFRLGIHSISILRLWLLKKRDKKHEILTDTNASLFETNEEQMHSTLDPFKHYC